MEGNIQRIKIVDLTMDDELQGRVKVDPKTVADYAETMSEDASALPPVKAIYDGKKHFLYDGYHRVNAAKKIGYVEIDVEVEQGTRENAVIKSCGANAEHMALRRTDGDKRRAVERLLSSIKKHRSSSGQTIADICHVSLSFAKRIKKEFLDQLATVASSEESSSVVGKDGKIRNTANISKANKARSKKREASAVNATETTEPGSTNGMPGLLNTDVVEKIEKHCRDLRDLLAEMTALEIEADHFKNAVEHLKQIAEQFETKYDEILVKE